MKKYETSRNITFSNFRKLVREFERKMDLLLVNYKEQAEIYRKEQESDNEEVQQSNGSFGQPMDKNVL